MRYCLLFEYDGEKYHGWQVQPDAVTVQQIITKCLSDILKQNISLVGAGRTELIKCVLGLDKINSGQILLNNKEIKITILNIRGNQVQIGIEAPKDITVHREEIFDRILHDKEENESS